MYGLHDHYDLAFSIGGGCACSQALRRAGMQFASFPFDWAGVKKIPVKLQILADDFKTLLSREKMVFVEPNTAKDKDIYLNQANGMLFLHDFPMGVPLEQSYDQVAEKYRRRADRLLALIARSKRVLVAHVCIPSYEPHADAEFLDSYEIIHRRFPSVEFDFLSISQKAGQPFSGANVRKVAEHLFRVDFDYHSEGSETIGDEHILAAALKQLVASVTDYRTPAEKAAYVKIRREKTLAFYHARNRWELFVNKINYKLMHHFQNRLERKGFKF